MDPLFDVHVCRLCLRNEYSLINIFESTDVNIVKILNKHIGEVAKTDVLPKFICTICLEKVTTFHEFYCDAYEGQQTFIRNWMKNECSNNAVKRDLNSIENESIFLGNYEYEANAALADGMEHVDVSNTITTIKVENIDIVERDSDTESSSDSDDDEGKKPKYAEIDKATVAAVIAQHFNRSCDLCPVELKSLKRAINHYRDEHNIAQGYLSCCGLKFNKTIRVEDHVRWHLNPDVFRCDDCDKSFTTRGSLSTHISRHKKSYTCDICQHISREITQLRTHMKSHIKRILAQTKCKFCSTQCEDKDDLQQHIISAHNQEANVQLKKAEEFHKTMEIDTQQLLAEYCDLSCDHCDAQFTTLEEAQYHYHHEHGITEGYVKCCGRHYKTTKQVRGHLLYHIKPELFKCTLCASQLLTLHGFRMHINQHFGNSVRLGADLESGVIEKRKYAYNLPPHLRRRTMDLNAIGYEENLERFFDMTCDKCPMKLDSLQHAKVHYFEYHGIDSGYIKCCRKEFRQLKDVTEHVAYHLNPDIFKCLRCGRACERKADMQSCMSKHRAVDSGKYKCDICERAFSCRDFLNKHTKSHCWK